MTRRSPLVIALIAVSLLLVLLATGVWRQYTMTSAARSVTLRVVEDTLSTSSARSLIANAHPDLTASIPAEALDSYIAGLPRILGDLQALTTLSGGADVALLPFGSRASSAQFTVGLEFARGVAEVQIELLESDGQWRITSYNVFSPLLSN